MKIKFISVTLFIVLCSMSVSCKKENIVEPQGVLTEVGVMRTILYIVDSVEYRITLCGEVELKTFVDNMVELANHGHCVNIADVNTMSINAGTKETHTYTTKDKDAASKWGTKMVEEGYRVSIIYNERTCEYVCIASR